MPTIGWIIMGVAWLQPFAWLIYGRKVKGDYIDRVPGSIIALVLTGVYLGFFGEHGSPYFLSHTLFVCSVTFFEIALVCRLGNLFFHENYEAAYVWAFIASLLFVAAFFAWLFGPFSLQCEERRLADERAAAAYAENVHREPNFMEAEEDIPIFLLTDAMAVSGSVSGGPVYRHYHVINGYIDSQPVYLYRCRNQYGALVTRHVTADENVSMIFDTLGEGEQPFLRTIHTYEVVTDNNIDPPEVTRRHKWTNYHFYVPAGSSGSELVP